MFYITNPTTSLKGVINVPGDKSISHRAVMLASIATGETHVSGFLSGADNRATLQIMRSLGVQIDALSDTELVIHGVGLYGLKPASGALDCGNAGTSMRLLAGLLAGQEFNSELTGDQYLLKRPMRRITEPLSLMGAQIATTPNGCAPLRILGGQRLHGITFDMPIASAQVKSCLVLAGLYAQGQTVIIEHAKTRDHTERMLKQMGYPLALNGTTITLEGAGCLTGCDIQVPADISSAAFFMVAAAITPGAQIILNDVGINPTRDGVLQILELMGAKIDVHNKRCFGDEPVADISVCYSELNGIDIPEQLVPLAIDELPVLMIAAACAKGVTVLKGARELRVKETDRIAAMADGLRALGIALEVFDDGMRVQGGRLHGGQVDSCGDHRIAMAFAVAGLVAKDSIKIKDVDHVSTSFPGFDEIGRAVGFNLTVVA